MTNHPPDKLTVVCDELQAALNALFPGREADVQRVRDAHQAFGITLMERATSMSASGVVAFVEEQARHTVMIQQLQEGRE